MPVHLYGELSATKLGCLVLRDMECVALLSAGVRAAADAIHEVGPEQMLLLKAALWALVCVCARLCARACVRESACLFASVAMCL